MKNFPWFRMYAEAVDNYKLKLLAFEDRWHFVAILCCKCQGILDSKKPELLHRFVAAKLGLSVRELEEVSRRLAEVGLIDPKTLNPIAWSGRQFRSDKSTDRVRKHRQKKNTCNADETQCNKNGTIQQKKETIKTQPKQKLGAVERACNVSVTPPDTDTDTDTDTDKEKRTTVRVPRPDNIEPQVWSDFLELRRQKKAALTKTAWDRIRGQIEKGEAKGFSANDMLAEAVTSGWQGFKLEWYESRVKKDQPKQTDERFRGML